MPKTESRSPLRVPTPLDRLAAEINELRPLPEAAINILRLADSDRFSAHELAALIARDAATTARLLRLANSAYYGFPRRISTVRDAVVLVGFRAVRSIVVVACVMDTATKTTSVNAIENWRFSVSVGVIAGELARAQAVDAEQAFTAGVLHNIGLVALDQHRPTQLRALLQQLRPGQASLHDLQRASFGFTDAELGGALAERWDFPAALVHAIRDHAQPLDALPDPNSLTACVMRGRMFARAHGLRDGIDRSGEGEAERDEASTEPARGEPPIRIETVVRRANAFLEATVL